MFDELMDQIPAFQTYYSVAEMHAHTCSLREKPGISVQTLGNSTGGYPIDLIYFDRGKEKTVFLWGHEDPTEPICGLSMTWLCDQLAANNPLLQQFKCNWAMIKCVNPDGALRNEGWYKRPGDLHAFFLNAWESNAHTNSLFFPMSECPEVAALQKAIALLKPDLLYNMHDDSHFPSSYSMAISEHIDAEALADHLSYVRSLGMPVHETAFLMDPSLVRDARWTFAPAFTHKPDCLAILNESGGYRVGEDAGFLASLRDYEHVLESLKEADPAVLACVRSHTEKIRKTMDRMRGEMKFFSMIGCGLRHLREAGYKADADRFEADLWGFITGILAAKEITAIPLQSQVRVQLHFLFTMMAIKGFCGR